MVDTRSDHTCAIRGSGLLYCWGENGNGQLGIGGTIDASVPTRVGSDADWMTVSAGGSGSTGGGWTCALKTDGSRWCWGVNGFLRRYGDPSSTSNASTPVRIDDGPWRFLALAARHGCAVRMDGGLYCWGDSSDGQTGQVGSPTTSPMQVGSEMDHTTVGLGTAFTCTTRSGGEVLCFGDNGSGQLGRLGGDSTSPVRACL
jgi:hypothetical protein